MCSDLCYVQSNFVGIQSYDPSAPYPIPRCQFRWLKVTQFENIRNFYIELENLYKISQ